MKEIQQIKQLPRNSTHDSIDGAVQDAPRISLPKLRNDYGGKQNNEGGHYPGDMNELTNLYGLMLLGAAYHADEQLMASGQQPQYLRLALDKMLGEKNGSQYGQQQAPIVQLPRQSTHYQEAA